MKIKFFVLFLFAMLTSMASAQIPNFWECPYTYAKNPTAFQAVLNRARTETVRVLDLGDSQETSPAGQGYVYVPRFNYGLFLRFGYCPETPIQLVNFNSQIATPFTDAASDWLNVVAQNMPLPQSGNTPSGWLPPHIIAAKYGTPAVNAGNLVMLDQDASSVHSGCNLTGTAFFDISHGVELEVFATTQPVSGDVRWFAKPTTNGVPNYNSPVTQTGTLGLSLSSPALSVVSGTTGPLNFGGLTHMQVDLYGTDDSNPTQIIGSRYRALGKQHGMVMSSFSAGGYRVTNFLNNHNQCGDVLRAMGFDIVFVSYGANESGIFTPEEHKSTLLSLISWYRTNVSTSVYFVLCTDPFNAYAGPSPNNFDRFAGAEYEIALADDHVIFINSRRGTEDLGWSAMGNYSLYMPDGVHYTPLGGRVKADFELSMLDTYINYSCYANCDNSTTAPVLTANDFQCYLNRFAAGDSYTNCDNSMIVPTLTANDFQCFLNKFAQGCP